MCYNFRMIKPMTKYAQCAALVATLFAYPSFAKNTIIKEASGVVVEAKPVKGSVDELFAVGEFDAPPEKVFALLWDITAQKEFMAPVKDATNISKGTTSRVDHIVFYGGVIGLKDRDVVSETTIKEKTSQKIRLRFKQKESIGPAPSDDYVRLTLREGGWDLTAIDEGTRTRAEFRIHTDPGINLGNKLAHSFGAKTIIGVFEAMRAKLKKG